MRFLIVLFFIKYFFIFLNEFGINELLKDVFLGIVDFNEKVILFFGLFDFIDS